MNEIFRERFVILDLERKIGPSVFHNFTKTTWRFITSVPLYISNIKEFYTLTCVSYRPKLLFNQRDMELTTLISETIAHNLLLNEKIHKHIAGEASLVKSVSDEPEEFHRDNKRFDSTVYDAELPGITSRFLMETLLPRRQIKTCNGVTYTTLRTWRASLKEWQIKALRNLKANLYPEFINTVASDVSSKVADLGILGMVDAVTNVPCGNSGPGCLSEQMASAVATIIGLPFRRIFQDIEVKGSSHPKRNLSRPRIRMDVHESSRFLLLDDVVTSGSHISEATSLVRRAGSTAFPVGWIGA